MRARSIHPLALIAAGVVACGGEDPTAPVDDAPVVRLSLSVASGDGQEGKAGEILPDPFAVRVTDESGAPVVGARVVWSITFGGGRLVDSALQPMRHTWTTHDGIARVHLVPTLLGTTTAAATIYGGDGSSVTFTADALSLVIDNIYWGLFLGPSGSDVVDVPAGGTVEWVNRLSTPVRIYVLEGPTDASSADSGILPADGRFEFVPQETGEWTWAYDYYREDGSVNPAGPWTLRMRVQ